MKKLCGIDEAGRGPLAGPLVVAGVVLSKKIEGLKDSKLLSCKKREALYKEIKKSSDWHLVIIKPDTIDNQGISSSMIFAIKEIMKAIPTNSYLFDGKTTFGIPNLKCQVKADRDIAEVSAASILAKVTRDRLMQNASKEFPVYGFEKHKGYGTKEHIEAIKKFGLSPIHRKSFKIKSLMQPSLFC